MKDAEAAAIGNRAAELMDRDYLGNEYKKTKTGRPMRQCGMSAPVLCDGLGELPGMARRAFADHGGLRERCGGVRRKIWND